MPTVHQPADILPEEPPRPRITPEFTGVLEWEAARRGLPPQPWIPDIWRPLPPPNITPLFTELLEQAAAERGLPYEPWVA
jgi:hypothetical protein